MLVKSTDLWLQDNHREQNTAEFESALIVERTKADIAVARAQGRNGGAPFKMTSAKLRLAQAAVGQPETKIMPLCHEVGISRQVFYCYVSPNGIYANSASSYWASVYDHERRRKKFRN